MNWHREHKARMRFGDRTAEWMSRRIGSMPSSFLHTMAFIACIVAVTLGEGAANTMRLALIENLRSVIVVCRFFALTARWKFNVTLCGWLGSNWVSSARLMT